MEATTTNKSSQKTEWEVEGMTCSTCAMSIDKKLEKLGLKEVHADFSSGEVSFINDVGVDPKTIEKEVSKLGFKVVDQKQEETKGLSSIEKKFLFSLLFAVPLFLHMFLPADWTIQHPLVQLGLALPVYALGFWHFGKSAFNGLRAGTANMDVLIFIGSTAAFGYSLAGTIMFYGTPAVHDHMFYETASTIITLVLLGNLMEHRSVNQTTTALKDLTKLKKTKAKRILDHEGTKHTEEIPAEQVEKGDFLLVNSGDKVPVDGIIQWGSSSVDESMITGESDPVTKKTGDKIIGGTILHDGQIKMKAEKIGDETVLSNIIKMVKQARQDKPSIQRLGDKVSSIFVPSVVFIALLTFTLSYWAFGIGLQAALMNSVAVLVISCPCAMGLATPTAVVSGIGRAAKQGILIKGGSTLEEYAKVQNVVFDKTGTLTTGNFKIKAIHPMNGIVEEEIKKIIYSLEQYSSHPIAKGFLREIEKPESPVNFENVEETKGKGMTGTTDKGEQFSFGSPNHANIQGTEGAGIFLTRNGELIARVEIEDEIRKGAKSLIQHLNQKGINTVMLSGDTEEKCQKIAEELGINTIHSEKLPEEKLRIITELSKKSPTAMVGDGINDAPALERANIGVSLGNATDVAIQSAQVVLLDGHDLNKVYESFGLSKLTVKTIKQNLFWAFSYNIVAIPIAALGFLNPMIAALAMAFSDVVVIGNSILLKVKRIK